MCSDLRAKGSAEQPAFVGTGAARRRWGPEARGLQSESARGSLDGAWHDGTVGARSVRQRRGRGARGLRVGVRAEALNTLQTVETDASDTRTARTRGGREAHGEEYGLRKKACYTLSQLEPATLARHADCVAARLEDAEDHVRRVALTMLGKLEPATFADYADCMAARLDDTTYAVRSTALTMLGRLEPATLTQYANDLLARLEDENRKLRKGAMRTLCALTRLMTRSYCSLFDSRSLRSRLLRSPGGTSACAVCVVRVKHLALCMRFHIVLERRGLCAGRGGMRADAVE